MNDAVLRVTTRTPRDDRNTNPMSERIRELYWSLRARWWQPRVRAYRLRREIGSLAHAWPHLEVIRVADLPYPVFLRPDSSDQRTFRDIFLDRTYDIDLPSVRTILDCGANIGLSVLWFLRSYPDARIVAVEPDADNYALAHRNLVPYADRVTLLHAAIWPVETTLAVRRGVFRDGGEDCTQVEPSSEADYESVSAVTVEGLLDSHSIDRLDLLKIDIEGAEAPLFATGARFLERTKVVLIELHDDACRDSFTRAARAHDFELHNQDLTTVAIRGV